MTIRPPFRRLRPLPIGRVMSGLRALILTALLLSAGFGGAAAQVMVAPPLVFMSDDDRFGTFMVSNQSTTPQEITIDFRFGYPATTQDGGRYMEYADSAAEARYSITSWLRAFPRRFVLAPGARQLVRFTIRPPADLEDGVYWTRLSTASTPVAPPVDTAAADGVSTRVVFRLEQITTVLYSAGEVEAAVEATPLAVAAGADSVRIETRVRRTGSAPFLGRAALRLLDASGAIVFEDEQLLSIYFDELLHFSLSSAGLAPGSYTAELALDGTRPDVPQDRGYPADPVLLRTGFTLE